MLWNFYHEIQEGDVVLARQGTKRLAAIGKVKSQAYYDKNKNSSLASINPEYDHCNFIDVEWDDNPRDKKYDGQVVFGIQTVYEIDVAEYKALISDTLTDIETLEEEIENLPQFFLEKYLQQFIIDNFDNIFDKKLVLLKDEKGDVVGKEYRTDVGRIDILAIEPATNSFVIIELKKGRESDKVVGQILRYMGWVSEELCKNDQTVRGIIICQESDDKLYYATKAAQNITLKHYHIDFRLFDAPFDTKNTAPRERE
jgi:restriction system protein